MVDIGDDAIVAGDEAALIGRQGDEVITAADWAALLDTIATRSSAASAPCPRSYR